VPAALRRPPGITDVAQAAGVSLSTVSRVLTGSARVSDDKKQRVLTAVAELGYRANGVARALQSGRQSMIAVLTGNTSRYGYAMTIQGIEEAARQAGYIVMIAVVESDDPQTVGAAVDLALSQPVAGALVLEYDAPGVAALRAMPLHVPVISVAGSGSRKTPTPHAFIDDRAGARRATEHLLGLGHATVHYLGIPSPGWPSGRQKGWLEALQAAGAAVPNVVECGWDPQEAYARGGELAADQSVTAVLCGNDELAVGVIRALADAGRSVPGEVSVIGFDGEPFVSLLSPALTSVEQDFTHLGHRAVRMLLDRIETGSCAQTSSALARLVVRESTAPPARGGPAR